MRVAAALLLAGCAHGLSPGAPLPPLHVRTMQGAPVRLDELRGPALVDLWATWCVPCARALPFYERMAKETGIRVIAISIDVDDAPVRRWLEEHATPFEILRDPDGAVAEQLGMKEMPTSYLLDREGRIRARHDGFREEDEPALEREIRQLLAGS